MSEIRGRFLWYELLTTDVEGAQDFYQKALGWGQQAWEGGDEPYQMFTVGERAIAGLMQLPEEAQAQGAPPHWLAYIGTPDVDATLARAEEAGARRYMDPFDIESVGRMVVLADPQGATIAFYTPEEPPTPPEESEGDFSWHELATDDPEAALQFYCDLFGWTPHHAFDMGDMGGGSGRYQLFGYDAETQIGGIWKRQEEMPVCCWLYYVTVSDLEATLERVREHGGQVLNGPTEVPGGGHVAQCMDPQGGVFALFCPPS